jgi:sialidase-1
VFRIPALCRAAKALLAFAEARPSVEDSGSIDLVMRRSTDGGRTWSELKKVVGDRQLSSAIAGVVGGMTLGNPVPLFVPPTSHYPEGRLLLMFCSNAASVNEDAIRADTTVAAGAGRRVWLSRSDDGGAVWSAPREITSQVKRAGWTWYATGPGGGLVLRNGSLVVPCTHSVHGSNEDHSHLLSSHDGGETWLASTVKLPSWWRHSALLWPPGADSPDSWLRYALETSR